MTIRHTAVGASLGTVAFILLALGQAALAATDAPATGKEVTPATPPFTKTVGIDIVKRTVNPDKTWSLEFQWKDKDGKKISRSVTVNENTVIGVDGQLKKMADITDDILKKKAVATVGSDDVTAVNLRFGRAMVAISKDQLTPAQAAALEAVAPAATPASEAALEKRVAEMVAELKLNDPAKEARLKTILATDLRAVRDSHNAGFAPAKSVRVDLNKGLQAELTPEQIETVKDKLTIGKVPFTMKAYRQIVTNMTPEQDAKVLDFMKQAREECLDVKNADEMKPIFEKYKTQSEQYLTSQGYDWKALYRKFVDSQKGN